MKKYICLITILILILIFIIISCSDNTSATDDKKITITENKTENKVDKSNINTPQTGNGLKEYKVKVLREIEHKGDRLFTQGFEIYNGYLYEGTGQYTETALRKIDLKTGDVIKQQNLEEYFPEGNMYFGEGITVWNDEIIQLSWQKKKVYVFSLDFEKKDEEFTNNYDGWGLTHNDEYLITSDGSENLYFMDPETFEEVRKLYVGIKNINELEYVNGIIYANVWMKTFIIMIDEKTGEIVGKIDARNLLCCQLSDVDSNAVLNGIAYNPDSKTFYITGKRCPLIYEVIFEPKEL